MVVTLAKGQVIDSIQKIRFTHPVITEKVIHLRRKEYLSLLYIFVIENGKFI
jgi:hypothetical protein